MQTSTVGDPLPSQPPQPPSSPRSPTSPTSPTSLTPRTSPTPMSEEAAWASANYLKKLLGKHL
jgi:hypothetical protein